MTWMWMFPKILLISNLLKSLRNPNLKYLVAKRMWDKLIFSFNESSKGSSKDSQVPPHESLSWELNSDSHSEE